MKIHIQKGMALNEVVTVEVHLKDPREWDEKVVPTFAKLDKRAHELNMRVIEANEKLRNLPTGLKADTQDVYNILHGHPLLNLQRKEQAEGKPSKDIPMPPPNPSEDLGDTSESK